MFKSKQVSILSFVKWAHVTSFLERRRWTEPKEGEPLNWHVVELSLERLVDIGGEDEYAKCFGYAQVENFFDTTVEKLMAWCNENCIGERNNRGNIFKFEDKRDAAIFRVFWQ